jgi:hypothetical protein
VNIMQVCTTCEGGPVPVYAVCAFAAATLGRRCRQCNRRVLLRLQHRAERSSERRQPSELQEDDHAALPVDEAAHEHSHGGMSALEQPEGRTPPQGLQTRWVMQLLPACLDAVRALLPWLHQQARRAKRFHLQSLSSEYKAPQLHQINGVQHSLGILMRELRGWHRASDHARRFPNVTTKTQQTGDYSSHHTVYLTRVRCTYLLYLLTSLHMSTESSLQREAKRVFMVPLWTSRLRNACSYPAY